MVHMSSWTIFQAHESFLALTPEGVPDSPDTQPVCGKGSSHATGSWLSPVQGLLSNGWIY